MLEKNKKWPIYKDSMLILGNPKSQVAVCSLWTKKEVVAEKLGLDRIRVIGNLYSPKKGISFLIRNILANPEIRYLILCGLDNSGSGQVLADLARKGFQKFKDEKSGSFYWKTNSAVENRIDIEIEEKALKSFCKSVEIIDFRKEKDYAKIKEAIGKLNQNLLPFVSKPLFFPEPKKEKIDLFPSETSAHIVRGKKVAEVWLKILAEIMRFGISDLTSYQNRQKEIIDLVSVVSEEDPDNLYMPQWLPHNKEYLENYLPTILTGNCPSDTSYTYGSRMRSYFGVDQIQKVIDEIKREKYSRRAVISLLDPAVDSKSNNPPCLNHCWFRVQSDKLYLIATLRSNDMFEAWTENAFGLRMLQNLVWKELLKAYPEIKLGDLVMHSLSAHIYDDSWEEAKQIIEKYYHSSVNLGDKENFDPRGNFIIRVDGGEIVVEHYSPEEKFLKVYKCKKAFPLYSEIAADNAISDIYHALYLGAELEKAETALKLGVKYEQDKELNLDTTVANKINAFES